MTAPADLEEGPKAGEGPDPAAQTAVPTWVRIVLALLVLAALGGILLLLIADRDKNEPEIIEDMFALSDGIKELNANVTTLNEQLAALLGATEGASPPAALEDLPDTLATIMSAFQAQFDELRTALETSKSDLEGPLADLEAEQEALRDKLEEIEASLPSEPPTPTLPPLPTPTQPEPPTPTQPEPPAPTQPEGPTPPGPGGG